MTWLPRHALVLRVFIAAGAAALVACGLTDPTEHQLRLQVAADSVDCVGAHGPRKCLSVRELVGGDAWGTWQRFFDPIEGFAHEPGFTYDLLVGRRTVKNPPADGSSYAYRLLHLLSKTAPPS